MLMADENRRANKSLVNEANRNGIRNAEIMSREDLIAALSGSNQPAPGAPATNLPPTNGPNPGSAGPESADHDNAPGNDAPHSQATSVTTESKALKVAPIIISALALLVSGLAALSSWWGTIAAVNRNTAEQEVVNRQHWQKAMVYQLIDEASKHKPEGITFTDLKDKYISAATAEASVKLGKPDLQPIELSSILLTLQAEQLVYKTTRDTYLPITGKEILGLESTFEVNRAIAAILTILSSRGGELTVNALEEKVVKEMKIGKGSFQHALISGGVPLVLHSR